MDRVIELAKKCPKLRCLIVMGPHFPASNEGHLQVDCLVAFAVRLLMRFCAITLFFNLASSCAVLMVSFPFLCSRSTCSYPQQIVSFADVLKLGGDCAIRFGCVAADLIIAELIITTPLVVASV
jgi:hypothetical protein